MHHTKFGKYHSWVWLPSLDFDSLFTSFVVLFWQNPIWNETFSFPYVRLYVECFEFYWLLCCLVELMNEPKLSWLFTIEIGNFEFKYFFISFTLLFQFIVLLWKLCFVTFSCLFVCLFWKDSVKMILWVKLWFRLQTSQVLELHL
jgi:hypothetical protein